MHFVEKFRLPDFIEAQYFGALSLGRWSFSEISVEVVLCWTRKHGSHCTLDLKLKAQMVYGEQLNIG